MKSVSEPRARSLIDAHFDRRISPSNERVMRSHLAECEACRKYYDSHLLFERLANGSTRRRERLATGLGLSLPTERTVPAWVHAVAFAAAAATAMVVLRSPGARHDTGAEFAARGGAPGEGPHVRVYKMNPARELEPNGRVKRSDALAFAYTNPGNFGHLLVFGVDEHRHVYWYHPAWTNHSEHPRAIAIEPGPAARELPEAVRHDLDGQVLTIYSLFLADDVPVERIEELVGESGPAGDELALRGAYEERMVLAVEP